MTGKTVPIRSATESVEESSAGRDAVAAVQRWRGVIDTLMHFNDMLMRTRSTAVGLVVTVFGAAAVSLARFPDRFITAFGVTMHVAALVVVPGLLLLASIFVLDYFYFYRMLLAVVRRAEDMEIESQRVGEPIALELTTCVSHSISRRRANVVLLFFYGIPALSGVLFLIYLVRLGPP